MEMHMDIGKPKKRKHTLSSMAPKLRPRTDQARKHELLLVRLADGLDVTVELLRIVAGREDKQVARPGRRLRLVGRRPLEEDVVDAGHDEMPVLLLWLVCRIEKLAAGLPRQRGKKTHQKMRTTSLFIHAMDSSVHAAPVTHSRVCRMFPSPSRKRQTPSSLQTPAKCPQPRPPEAERFRSAEPEDGLMSR